jgi:hypothetical protein
LFVLAAPVAQAPAQVTALADQPDRLPLHLLTPPDEPTERGGAVVAESVYVLPPGRIRPASIDPVLLSSLRQSAFDRVVVGCASEDLSLYENVRTVAEAVGAPTVLAMLRT